MEVNGRPYVSALLPLDLMLGSRVGPKIGLGASQNGNSMSSNCRKSKARNGEMIVQAAKNLIEKPTSVVASILRFQG